MNGDIVYAVNVIIDMYEATYKATLDNEKSKEIVINYICEMVNKNDGNNYEKLFTS